MLKLYNTLSRKKEVFRPRKGKTVAIFVCGPTVYDVSHIGHARTYLVFDMFVKYLRQKGYGVFYLQNITDVDDKIILRAKKEKVFWKDLSLRFEKEYLKDMKALNVNSVTKYARATAHIKEIISQVKRLLEKGYAYKIEDGIYYDISKFKNYGELAGRTKEQAEDGVSRIDESKEKRNKGDFCLWKFSKASEPEWKSPFGRGRPGWHIEDTAIAEKYFGPQYDIHGGARDLIFPHHEAEISQMEAISGKSPVVNYWLHTGFLTVKGQKMAKSLGNFITIKDFLKNHSVRDLRLFILKTHYRSPINYSEKEIKQVEKQIARIDEFINKIKMPHIRASSVRGKPCTREISVQGKPCTREISVQGKQNSKLIKKIEEKFDKAMEDDFNTPKAIAAIFKLINQGNSLMDKKLLSQADAKKILKFLKEVNEIFGFIFGLKKKEKIPLKIKKLVEQREKYRQEKNWRKADTIRKEVEELGYRIEDTRKGPVIKISNAKKRPAKTQAF